MEIIELPDINNDGALSLERVLSKRRSIREYHPGPLTLAEVSQLLWAPQGLTSAEGLRTAPSAGALYPLELYLVAGDLSGLPSGIYRYLSRYNELHRVVTGDKRASLAAAAFGQKWVKESAAVVVFAAVYERVTIKYGERGVRYTHIEVGHAAQNLSLQAAALNLGTVTVGAFNDAAVKKLLHMGDDEQPLYLMPLGRLAD